MAERKHKEGDTVTVPGFGKGKVVGRPSAEGRVVVELEDGTRVNYGGTFGGERQIEARIEDLAARLIEPGWAGVPAVGPGDNNAGDPLFHGPRDQPLIEQPLDEDVDPKKRTPVELTEDMLEGKEGKVAQEQAKAAAGTQTPPAIRDKAVRGPKEQDR